MRLSKVVIAASLLYASLIPIHAFSLVRFFPNWSIGEYQPNLEQGGRTNSVAVNPFEPNEMLAASDSGGLFRSIDGGMTWQHVEELRTIFTQAIAYVPARRGVVLVTAKEDWKTANGGGVWRSEDGGATFSPVTLNVPPEFLNRISGFGISAVDDNVVVGTSECLFVSTDGGQNWTPSSPFPAGNRRVVSVLLTPGSSAAPPRIYAGGPAGLRLNTLPLGEWTSPLGFAPDIRSIHAFGASARSNDHAYVAIEQRLFGTENRGDTWTEIATMPEPVTCTGTPFVKTAVRSKGAAQYFVLYHGNTCRAQRMAIDLFGVPTPWQPMAAAHFPRDLALYQNRPTLLASNGGVHETMDGGDHWTFVGGGAGGYNALQVTDIKGQLTAGLFPRLTLYFGTQDNNLWAMDAMRNPQGHDEAEGFFIDTQRRFGKATGGDPGITYVACSGGGCRPRVASQLLVNPRDVNHSPMETAAPVVVRPGERIQNVLTGLDVTHEPQLIQWQAFASFPEQPVGLPKVGSVGPGGDSVIYQAHGFSPTSAHLLRIDASAGNVTVRRPVGAGLRALAVNRPMPKAWYPVFAVDHGMPDRVIAADISFEQMARSTDGAVTFNAMTQLTDDVTQHGDLLFRANVPDFGNALPLVTAISYHPVDPTQVLLGTAEGGIYYSGDRGATWGKIGGTDPATYVTSFYWESLNRVYVSTFGRGIWRLENHPIAFPTGFDELCATCDVMSNDGKARPPFDNSALVFEGRILGIRTDNKQLREVFVTAGSSVVFTADPKDPQDEVTITEVDGDEKADYEPVPEHPKGWMATGVVFTSDDVVTGTVYAEGEMGLPVPEEK